MRGSFTGAALLAQQQQQEQQLQHLLAQQHQGVYPIPVDCVDEYELLSQLRSSQQQYPTK
jgi:hypothetical protein